MRHTFYTSLLACILIACHSNETATDQWNIALTDQIWELPLPENTGHFYLNTSYYNEGGDVQLLIFDLKNYAIHQLDVNSTGYTRSIVLEKEGPNGINSTSLYGVLMEHPDSIYIFRGMDEIIQMNTEGNVIRRIPVDIQLSEKLDISLYPESFVRKGEDFFIPSVPLTFQWNDMEINDILHTPSATKFNSGSNQLVALSTFNPDFIGKNLNKPLFPKFHKGPNGDLILAYNFKDVTIIHPDGSQSIKTLKASMVPDEAPASNKNIFEDMGEFARIFHHSNIYIDLHYFEDHQVLMRIVQLEEDIPEVAHMQEYLPQQYVLLFYDQAYTKIGEILLDKDRYNPLQFFSTPEGIFISLDHPNNADLEENVMRFQKIHIR